MKTENLKARLKVIQTIVIIKHHPFGVNLKDGVFI